MNKKTEVLEFFLDHWFQEADLGKERVIQEAVIILNDGSRNGLKIWLGLPIAPDLCLFSDWNFTDLGKNASIYIKPTDSSEYKLYEIWDNTPPWQALYFNPIELPLDKQNKIITTWEGIGTGKDPYTRVATNVYEIGMYGQAAHKGLHRTARILVPQNSEEDIFNVLKLY